MSNKVICILGPTGVGKTALAIRMAKSLGGEIVNLDKIYTYKRFSIGTGLSDNEKEIGVPTHLYKLLEPDEEIIPPGEFVKKVKETCLEINKLDKLAIIEGGSSTYFPALYFENREEKFIDQFIGLCFPEGFDIAGKISMRIEAILDEGLIDEVKMGLRDYPNSLIMNDCHFIVPMIDYLKREIDLPRAKAVMLHRNLEYIEKQMKCFRAYPEIKWTDCDKVTTVF